MSPSLDYIMCFYVPYDASLEERGTIIITSNS